MNDIDDVHGELRSADEQPIVEHAGMLEDDDGVEHIVLMDQTGYAETRTADDPRWGRDWRCYDE